MAQNKQHDQAIRQAIVALTSQGRDVTTSAILSTLQAGGIKAKPSEIYASTAWKELLAGEKRKSQPVMLTDEAPARKTKP